MQRYNHPGFQVQARKLRGIRVVGWNFRQLRAVNKARHRKASAAHLSVRL